MNVGDNMAETTTATKASVPTVRPKKEALPIDPEWAEHYAMFSHRWIGEAGKANALKVLGWLKARGHSAGLFDGEDKEWNKGKYEPFKYYKVFIHHPSDRLYYTWFAPSTKEAFAEPIDFTKVTWFEFIRSTEK